MKEGSIFIVIIFPRPWPLSSTKVLMEKSEGNSVVKVIADNTGRLSLVVTSQCYQKAYRFQPILLQGDGRALISIVWNEESASLRINKHEVQPDDDCSSSSLLIETKVEPPESNQSALNILALGNEHDESTHFFVDTLRDVESRLSERTKYGSLRAAGLLRQLLLDGGNSLLNIVNRKYREKIEFETIDYNSKPPHTPDYQLVNLDASMFPKAKTVKSNLDTFLRIPCILKKGDPVTVKDVIRTCANVKGGVHLGIAKSTSEKTVVDFDEIFQVLENQPSQALLEGLCKITLTAMKPIIVRIEKDV